MKTKKFLIQLVILATSTFLSSCGKKRKESKQTSSDESFSLYNSTETSVKKSLNCLITLNKAKVKEFDLVIDASPKKRGLLCMLAFHAFATDEDAIKRCEELKAPEQGGFVLSSDKYECYSVIDATIKQPASCDQVACTGDFEFGNGNCMVKNEKDNAKTFIGLVTDEYNKNDENKANYEKMCGLYRTPSVNGLFKQFAFKKVANANRCACAGVAAPNPDVTTAPSSAPSSSPKTSPTGSPKSSGTPAPL